MKNKQFIGVENVNALLQEFCFDCSGWSERANIRMATPCNTMPYDVMPYRIIETTMNYGNSG